MYKYQDFKHLFGEQTAELKMIAIYSRMKEDHNYKTTELLSFVYGDSWETLACIDRLVELRLIRCVDNTTPSRNYWSYRKC